LCGSLKGKLPVGPCLSQELFFKPGVCLTIRQLLEMHGLCEIFRDQLLVTPAAGGPAEAIRKDSTRSANADHVPGTAIQSVVSNLRRSPSRKPMTTESRRSSARIHMPFRFWDPERFLLHRVTRSAEVGESAGRCRQTCIDPTPPNASDGPSSQPTLEQDHLCDGWQSPGPT
jgi:hypothetical protein